MRIIFLLFLMLVGNLFSDDINDPFEGFNRKTFDFNEKLDDKIAKPLAEVYAKTPKPIKKGVTNFFNNLEEIDTSINQLLQGKVKFFFNDFSRFIINSTIGLAGFIDIATKIGLDRHDEDFGQTLAGTICDVTFFWSFNITRHSNKTSFFSFISNIPYDRH